MKAEQITRRGLLMAGAAALTARGSAAESKPRAVRFGVRTPLPKVGLHERAMLAGRLGYDGIELGHEWLNQPVEAIQEQLAGTGVVVSAIVGSIQLLDTDPQKRAEGVELDRRRLRMAKDLGADCVIEVPVFGANKFQDISPLMTAREIEEKLLIAGLKQLTEDVQRTGITMLLEPCNHKETHFMNRQSQAAEIIEAVGAPGFRILSDFYHMQLEE
ncbi:MAG: sugar phosphate isomerase/epimerase family protein, partial [Bryobacteraceae bacterium]